MQYKNERNRKNHQLKITYNSDVYYLSIYLTTFNYLPVFTNPAVTEAQVRCLLG